MIGRRGVLTGGAALWVGAPAIVKAQSSSKVHVSHGFAMHGEPKYPTPPQTLDYVNPNAPKGLNENYGRELMELHTLGVDGGYTQKDVTEVARAFTGWTIQNPRMGGGYRFEPRLRRIRRRWRVHYLLQGWQPGSAHNPNHVQGSSRSWRQHLEF